MTLALESARRIEHPVDVVERLAHSQEWRFERADEDELSFSVDGGWTSYHLAFTWLPDLEALHMACAFDLKVPKDRQSEVLALLALINEQLWLGHFDVWTKDKVIMFRQALMLSGGISPNARQCEAAVTHAVAACERYYQAFQFVVWAGKGAREALDGAMFETEGHA